MSIEHDTALFNDQDNWRNFFAKAMRNRSFIIGAIITLVIAAMAIFSFFWTPYDVTNLEIANRLKKPNGEFLFGTDHFGRDIFSMIMVGARNSIAVAIVAVGIGLLIGVPLGTLAAAKKGWLEEVLMRFNDLVFAFPALLSAVMITAIFGPGAINAIIAIGIFNIPVFARLSRSAAMAIWPREFVMAARVAGKSNTPNYHRTYPAKHRQSYDRAGNHPIFPRHFGRSWSFLCRPWHSTADAFLGPHVV